MPPPLSNDEARTKNPVTVKDGSSSASNPVRPAQSIDSQILIQDLKNVLAKDASGATYSRELKDVAYRLSIALETPGDTVQRVAYYVRTMPCFSA